MLLCILGRQPRLGLAELEALFGAHAVRPLGREAALLDSTLQSVDHTRLGGSIKIAELIATIPSTNWSAVVGHCSKKLPTLLQHLPEGKIKLGLSTYGLATIPRQLERSGLELKKIIKTLGHSVRLVPNTDVALNSAQVWHNHLTSDLGLELLFVADRGQTYLARTLSVQDVERYGQRDFGRPKRDARVGMLPPKLAQIMLNLAAPKQESTILDPFCGTGVVLMEAALQGYSLQGSDLNPKMIEYTQANLAWLAQAYGIQPHINSLQVADATTHQWQLPLHTVVTETYLGRPLATLPDQSTLQAIMRDCNAITRAFLANLASQLSPGARCCIAIPAWKTKNSFLHLPVVDDLKKMGYNRISFSHARREELIYHRPDQVVARELLILTR